MTRNLAVGGPLVFALVLLAVPTGRADDCDREPSGTPAFQAVVRADFLSHGLAQYFRRCFPVNEQAEEGSISSTVEVIGRAYVVPEPSKDRIAVQVILEAAARANSVRSRDKIHLLTRERASLFLAQEVFVDKKAVCLGGLGVFVSVYSQLLQVFTEYKGPADDFVQGIVESVFERRRPKDDRRIAEGVEQKMYEEIPKEAEKALKDVNKGYETLLKSLRDAGLEEDLRFSTDPEAIRVTVRSEQPSLPVPPSLSNEPVSVQLHESLINQRASRKLAGRTYTDEELEKTYNDLAADLDLPPLPKSEEPPWSIRLAQRDPLTLKLDGNAIELTERIETFVSGMNRYNAMNVTVRYHIVKKGDELRLVRDEELEILPPDFKPGTALGGRQQIQRTMLQRRLGRLLPKEITFREINLPESLPSPGAFRIDSLQTQGGWLNLGMGYHPGKPKEKACPEKIGEPKPEARK